MRVLIATISNRADNVFLAHLETVCWQDADVETALLVLSDGLTDTAQDAVRAAGGAVWQAGPKPPGAHYSIDEVTHLWQIPTFHWLAHEKQRVLDYALADGFDAVWLVDSDLLVAPDTLRRLLEDDKPIVAGVFWTEWLLGLPEGPNLWTRQPAGFGPPAEALAFFHELRAGVLTRVAGTGACTLIRRSALERGAAFWPLLEGLPYNGMWQGEDRHFCLRAQLRGIERWVDSRCRIWHCYRPSDEPSIPDMLDRLRPMEDAMKIRSKANGRVLEVKDPLGAKLLRTRMFDAVEETEEAAPPKRERPRRTYKRRDLAPET